jgi:hypothetical protein
MKFRVARWDMLDDSLVLYYARETYLLGVPTVSVMFLHFSMQEEDILEHTNGECHLCTL